MMWTREKTHLKTCFFPAIKLSFSVSTVIFSFVNLATSPLACSSRSFATFKDSVSSENCCRILSSSANTFSPMDSGAVATVAVDESVSSLSSVDANNGTEDGCRGVSILPDKFLTMWFDDELWNAETTWTKKTEDDSKANIITMVMKSNGDATRVMRDYQRTPTTSTIGCIRMRMNGFWIEIEIRRWFTAFGWVSLSVCQ